MLTTVRFLDVKGQPTVITDLPPLKIGDPLGLHLRVERQNSGRTEELVVDGQYRIIATGIDASSGPSRQLLSVEAIRGVPVWRSIKKRSPSPRRLAPARSPKTSV
jgi:hypothetical protein